MTSSVVSDIPEKYKSAFCDCFLLKVKKKYPNGINESIPMSFQDSIYHSCKKELDIK